MERRADKRAERLFVYVSDAKLARFLSKLSNRSRLNILKRIQVTLSFSIGLVNLLVQPQPGDGSVRNRVRAERVAKVEEHIRQEFVVGDLAVGEDWITGRADMRWGQLRDRPTVLFCGYAGPLLVALTGSFAHVIGEPTSDNRTGSYPVISAAVLNGDDPENLGNHLAAAARTMGSRAQSVRFLAQVITRGTVTGDGPQREFVLATPLYVEEADRADESVNTAVQGTVQWFSADRGWGLIDPDGVADAVVIEASAVPAGEGQGLAVGQRVEFAVTHDANGILATSVRPLRALAGEAEASAPAVTRGPGDPARIGGYEIMGRLGQGSMGVVFLAKGDDGLVAIKVILPEHAREPELLRRFQEEADNARRVRAPNVARVLDAVTTAEHPYLVTEFIPGPTLQQQVEEHGPLPEQSAIDVSAGVAAALDAIHKAGLVHRDLKPSNVILSPSGPKVIDFGLARSSGKDIQYTQFGMPIGTPAYMSPEQIEQDTLTPASDIFSWAGLTVFAASGHQPFARQDSPLTVVWREISHGTPNLSEVPSQLRHVITAALDKTPTRRPAAAQLLERLSPGTPRGRTVPRLRLHRRPSLGGRIPWSSARLAAGGTVVAVLVAVAVVLIVALPPSSPTRSLPSPSPTRSLFSQSPGQSRLASESVALPGPLIGSLTDPNGYELQGVAFRPDGKTIAASLEGSNSSTGHIDLWSLSENYHLTGPLTDNGISGGLAFSPTNANGLAVADEYGLDLWNMDSRSFYTYSDPDDLNVFCVAYMPGGKTVAEVDVGGHVYLINAANGQWSSQTFTDSALSSNSSALPSQVLVDPTGKTLALADMAGNVYVWKFSGGPPDVVQGANASSRQPLAFSRDGDTLAIADPDDVELLDVKTGKFSAPLGGPYSEPEALAFSPIGDTLADADGNGKIYLWNLTTRKEKSIRPPAGSITGLVGGLAFSPDGKTLAVFGLDGTKIYLYRINYSKP